MKNIFFKIIIPISIVGLAFIACNKNESINPPTNDNLVEKSVLTPNSAISWKCECIGSNSCDLSGIPSETVCGVKIESGQQPANIVCICSDCIMQVTFKNSTGGIISTENVTTPFPMDFIEEFLNYSLETYNVDNLVILSVEKLVDGEDYMVIYEYLNTNGGVGTIAFARAGEKKYQFECTGNCDSGVADCRERFVLATKSIECTCTGCQMIVTELAAGSTNN